MKSNQIILTTYLKGLVGKFYKILPLKESADISLDKYLNSLHIELIGALNTFPELSTENKYISLLNTINYFITNPYDKMICKREVFKCIDNIKSLAGDTNG